LDVFWPTFWATTGGVGLAIPAGLFLDRLAKRVEKQARRKDTCEALDHLLVALRASLGPLASIPGDVDFAIEGSILMIMWRPQQAVWDLLSPVVVEGVADSALKVRLGRCFELLQGLALLLDRLYELEYAARGPYPLAAPARTTADGVKKIVKERAELLAALIDEVCSETDAYLAAHRPR
jgi:hypothetical protein